MASQGRAKKFLYVIADGIPADIIESVMLPNLLDIKPIPRYRRTYVGGEKGTYSETATYSAPGFMNLLTGTWGNKHNVYNNVVNAPNYHYKNIFRLLKEQQSTKKIAIFSTWIDNRIKLIGEGLSMAGNITFDYKFDGYELDKMAYPQDTYNRYIYNIDQRVTDEASQCIETQGPDLSWVYLQYTDNVGHHLGDSKQFYQAVNNVFKQITKIWKAIDRRMKQYEEDWFIIVTTDHGRDPDTGTCHSLQSNRERMTWMMTNSQIMNTYFRDFEPGIVDIFPTIARFMNLTIPIESERELDGVPLIGKVSLVKPLDILYGDNLSISWQVVDHGGNVNVWLSTTNLFKDGTIDQYNLIETVPIDKKMVTIDLTKYPSQFYKIVLEGQYNMVNRWVLRSNKIQQFDPNSEYRLSTEWQSDNKSLDIFNDGTNNNRAILALTGAFSGQYWKIIPIDDVYFRILNKWQGENKSLDILNNGINNKQAILAPSVTHRCQYWKITPIDNIYFRISNKWQGDNKSLDILNDGTNNNQPILAPTGNQSGQRWKITKV